MAKYKHMIKLKDLLDSGESIKPSDRKAATERIGKRALELMKADMNKYQSSVTGKPFKHLKDKAYQKKKGSNRSNLRLTGALQAGLGYINTSESVSLTIDADNSAKAENHLKTFQSGNIISKAAESKTGVKQRKFFPTGSESLRKGIMDKLKAEISDLIESDE